MLSSRSVQAQSKVQSKVKCPIYAVVQGVQGDFNFFYIPLTLKNIHKKFFVINKI